MGEEAGGECGGVVQRRRRARSQEKTGCRRADEAPHDGPGTPLHAAARRYTPLHAATCRCAPLHAATCRYMPLRAATCRCAPLHAATCRCAPLHAAARRLSLTPSDPSARTLVHARLRSLCVGVARSRRTTLEGRRCQTGELTICPRCVSPCARVCPCAFAPFVLRPSRRLMRWTPTIRWSTT